MASCPNCGRKAMRTQDWACQWCGYPLVSGSFRPISKTYQEVKEEGLRRPPILAEEPASTEEPAVPEETVIAERSTAAQEAEMAETEAATAEEVTAETEGVPRSEAESVAESVIALGPAPEPTELPEPQAEADISSEAGATLDTEEKPADHEEASRSEADEEANDS